MATPAETPPPAKADSDPSQNGASPTASPPPAASTDVSSSSSESKPPSAPSDPLSAIGSIWSGWMAPTPSADAANSPSLANPDQTTANAPNEHVAAAAAAANDWFAGAGKMLESAVKDVGSKLKSAAEGVDKGMIGEQVAVIRQKSGRLVEDVTKSVQNINLNIDQDELQKKAEVISNSTRDLLDKATQKLEQGRVEALEIFVDKDITDGGSAGLPPWDVKTLPENERQYADALRQEMLKIVVDCIYSKKRRTDLFLTDVAEREKFEFVFQDNAGMATAALDSDRNMRRLRAGLVPGKMREETFWRTYFYHVHRVRQTLVANEGVMPEVEAEDVDDDPAALFGDEGDDEELAALTPPTVLAKAGGEDEKEGKAETKDSKRNWDDEIDAIFDEGDE